MSTTTNNNTTTTTTIVLSPTQYDTLTKLIIEKFQIQGENITMDDLLEIAITCTSNNKNLLIKPIQEILTTLLSLELIEREKLHGMTMMHVINNTLYSYRIGYSLGISLPLGNIQDQMKQEENKILEQEERIKKLKLELTGDDSFDR
jgi:hypothetical protein